MHDIPAMYQRSAAKHSDVAKTELPHSVKCVQCGEALDHKRMHKFFERAQNPLCADCAFDTIPCTD